MFLNIFVFKFIAFWFSILFDQFLAKYERFVSVIVAPLCHQGRILYSGRCQPEGADLPWLILTLLHGLQVRDKFVGSPTYFTGDKITRLLGDLGDQTHRLVVAHGLVLNTATYE